MVTLIGKRLVIASRVGGLVLSGLMWAAPGPAQSALAQQSTQQSSTTSTTKSTTTKPAAKSTTKSTAAKPATTAKKTPPKPLVYIDDERSVKSADASTGKTAGTSSANKSAAAPANPKQSADLTKAFQQNCPSVGLTDSKAKATYDVTFQREPGAKGVKGAFGLTNAVHKTSKIEVMSKSGKELFSETGHSTNQLVKDACTAIGTPGLKVAKN